MTPPVQFFQMRVSVIAAAFVQFGLLFASFFSVRAFPQAIKLQQKQQPPTRIFSLPLASPEAIKGFDALREKTKLSRSLPESDAELFAAATTLALLPPSFLRRKDDTYEDFTKWFQQWTLTLNAPSIERLATNLNTDMKTKLNFALISGEAAELASASDAGRSLFFTRAGADAMALYATYLFDRGKHLLAAALFLEILELQAKLAEIIGSEASSVLPLPVTGSLKFKAAVALSRSHDQKAALTLFAASFQNQETIQLGKAAYRLIDLRKELHKPPVSAALLINDFQKELFLSSNPHAKKLARALAQNSTWLKDRIHLLTKEAGQNLLPFPDLYEDLFDLESYFDVQALVDGRSTEPDFLLFAQVIPTPVLAEILEVTKEIKKLEPFLTRETFDFFRVDLKKRRRLTTLKIRYADNKKKVTPDLIPTLIEMLTDPYHVRDVKQLISTVSDEAVPLLIEALSSEKLKLTTERSNIRSGAVECLGVIAGKYKAQIPVVFPHILRALADRDLEVRSRAVRALPAFGAAAGESLPLLLEILEKEDVSSEYVIDTIAALAEHSPAALDALIAAASGQRVVFRMHAVSALGNSKIGRKRAFNVLVTALDDEIFAVRLEAVRALGKLKSEGQAALAPLKKRLLVEESKQLPLQNALKIAIKEIEDSLK